MWEKPEALQYTEGGPYDWTGLPEHVKPFNEHIVYPPPLAIHGYFDLMSFENIRKDCSGELAPLIYN